MKKLILILAFAASVLSAQETKKEKQGIELPDFVITGLESVAMPEMEKEKPPFVSTLSREFFNPSYSPEVLTLGAISTPEIKKAEEESLRDPNSGKLNIGAGLHVLPRGLFHFSESFGNFMVSTQLWGGNQKDYIDYAGYNYSGGKINSEIFVSNGSSFLPGLRLGVNALYKRAEYNTYGSVIQDYQRKEENMVFGVSLANHKDNYIKYNASADASFFKLPLEGNNGTFEDRDFRFAGDVDLFLKDFSVRSNAEYIIQDVSNGYYPSDGENYYAVKSLLYYRPSLNFSLSAGVFLSGTSENSALGPVVNLKLKLTDEVSLLGAYSTSTTYSTAVDFFAKNRFLDLNNLPDYVYEKTYGNIKAAIDFEFSKYFEVIAGFEYADIDNHWFFNDLNGDRLFEINLIDNYKRTLFFAQTNFHLGPYGIFYGEFNYFGYSMDDFDKLPYEPDLIVSAAYGYEVFSGFNVNAKALYRGAARITTFSEEEVDATIFLSGGVKYEFLKGLEVYTEVENILNRKDEVYKNYQEKPLDIVAGIEYRW